MTIKTWNVVAVNDNGPNYFGEYAIVFLQAHASLFKISISFLIARVFTTFVQDATVV